MQKIVVNRAEMLTAANSISGLIEDFRNEKNQTMQASQALSEGWEGTAAQEYLDTMTELTNWMEQMSAVLDEYPAALKEIEAKYGETDRMGAGFFGG